MAGTFSDKGLAGASHHAVIPNHNTIESLRDVWPRLSADERRLFDVVARSYLAAMMPDFRYRQTTALLDVQGHSFRAAGRQPMIEYRDMPAALQPQYQYFTQADMSKLRAAGYDHVFTPVDQGILIDMTGLALVERMAPCSHSSRQSPAGS